MRLIVTICLSVIMVWISFDNLRAQEENGIGPASLRQGKITSHWYDRGKVVSGGTRPEGKYLLWYQDPAVRWEEALPLGNGRMGAMVFGGVSDERIQLNESTLWDGYALDPNDPSSLDALPKVQKLLFEGKNNEAVVLAEKNMMGNPRGVKPYQSLGEIWFDTPHCEASQYVRSLDLSTAITTTRYESEGVNYIREAFISPVDKVLIIRFFADKKSQINFSLSLKRQQDAHTLAVKDDLNSLVMSGRISTRDEEGRQRGLSFATQVKAINKGGNVKVKDGILHVSEANEVMLLVAGATNYPGFDHLDVDNPGFSEDPVIKCAKIINKASRKSYPELKKEHVKEHKLLFDRVDINLSTNDQNILSQPTDKRLELAREKGIPDPGLVETFFQYGRYLLISSSRVGTMPANLQGLWAWQMNPPWNADYHTNINLQMNYWPTEIANLSELHEPLFDLMKALVKPGGKTAKVMYGADGWVVHHLTDAWGFTAPADGPQGIWPMGSAWLARHPWEHYVYTGDKEFLKETAYPLMKGAGRFIMDFLIEAPEGTSCSGKLVTNPSYSPENAFYLPNGETSVFTYGATMDLEIIHDLLTHCIEASDILDIDKGFQEECQKTLDKLAPVRISRTTGRIMEWAEDYKEVEPHHRHTSHLFGLYPGNQITLLGTPDLAEAAKKTLIARGDDGTGWSLAWKINMWNRLHEGEHSYKLLSVLLATKTLPNLFDNHPPFQIDGNFGATAAIAEMFVQSQSRDEEGNFIIELLPALPAAFPNGSVEGICARSGFVVDLEWEDHEVKKVDIQSRNGEELNVRFGDFRFEGKTTPGEKIQLNHKLDKK